MALTFGKRDVAKMAAVLDPEYTTLLDQRKALKKETGTGLEATEVLIAEIEGFAYEALIAAEQIIQDKAKFTVVGQVKQADGKGDKVALGWYATEKQALGDALSLTYSTATHEEHLAWVLKVHHGTPASYYQARKAALKVQAASDSSFREQELQRRIKWCEDHPGQAPPKEWGAIPAERDTIECPMCDGVGRTMIDLTYGSEA